MKGEWTRREPLPRRRYAAGAGLPAYEARARRAAIPRCRKTCAAYWSAATATRHAAHLRVRRRPSTSWAGYFGGYALRGGGRLSGPPGVGREALRMCFGGRNQVRSAPRPLGRPRTLSAAYLHEQYGSLAGRSYTHDHGSRLTTLPPRRWRRAVRGRADRHRRYAFDTRNASPRPAYAALSRLRRPAGLVW